MWDVWRIQFNGHVIHEQTTSPFRGLDGSQRYGWVNIIATPEWVVARWVQPPQAGKAPSEYLAWEISVKT